MNNIKEFKQQIADRKAILGIDYGTKRIGLAISDLSCTIATSYKILYRKDLEKDLLELKAVINEKEIGAIVMGLPLQMNGKKGEIAQEVEKFATVLQDRLNLPLLFWDERLSSSAVENFLIKDVDLSRKKRAKILDASAAAYILQGALDALKYA